LHFDFVIFYNTTFIHVNQNIFPTVLIDRVEQHLLVWYQYSNFEMT
jgi:hypothetical protein